MSNAAVFQTRFLRVAATTFVFGIVGPPIGGISMMLPMLISWLVQGNQVSDPLGALGGGFVLAVVLSYPLAVIPALLVGSIVGLLDAIRGNTSLVLALFVGSVVGLFWVSLQELRSFVE